MNTIKQKLRSRRGASITFALLLFLVCVVVGSVVLAAGSAAAGRMAKSAEMDRRYYSVTSAADLLAKELTGKTVTITRVRKETTETTVNYHWIVDVHEDPADDTSPVVSYWDDDYLETTQKTAEYTTTVADGSKTGADGADSSAYAADVVNVQIDDASGTETNEGKSITRDESKKHVFLTERAIDLMFGHFDDSNIFSWNKTNCKAAMVYSFYSFGAMGQDRKGTFTLDPGGSLPDGVTAEDMKIYGEYTLKTDGTLEIMLSDQADMKGYTLTLTLSPQIGEGTPMKSETGPNVVSLYPQAEDSWDYAETTTTVETTTITSTIQWKVKSVEKSVEKEAE